MSYELIVSEKPTSAKRIADSLADGKAIKKEINKVPYYEITRGDRDIVVATAAGHLYSVAEKEKSQKYPSFDIEWKPSSDVSKSAAFSKKYLTVLKKLAKDADTVTVATDYDVEGEVIGLNIVRFAAKKTDARRMKFSTLTKDDLIEAYENAQDSIDWGQANAGETRHFLDWMYGINLSRALMSSIKKAGTFKIMSVGRVQGPALKIVVDREHEIEKFEPQTYWMIKLLANKEGNIFESFHKGDKFWEKDKADWFFGKAAAAENVTVQKVEKEEKKQPPPTPFDLGTLQSEAYRHFSINPKVTLEVAQKLYSAGYISYPRTSSQKLTPKIGFKKILEKLAANPAFEQQAKTVLGGGKLKPNDGKKSDPAHPAIYPTGSKPRSLSGYDEKIYDLVVKRFIATFGEWATRETIKVELNAGGETFLTTGRRTVIKAWQDLYAPYVKQEESELPDLIEGEIIGKEIIDLLEKQTEPPNRYNAASLVKELEKRNLGTKATRADVVDSLYKRGYIHEDRIRASEMGIKTVDTLAKYSPEILDEKLTTHFEADMEKVRDGSMKRDEVLEESKKVLIGILEHFDQNLENIGNELKEAHINTLKEQSYLGKCPKCEGNIVMKRGKSGKRFAACDKYPDCEQTYPLPQSGLIKTANKTSEHGSPMVLVIRKGKRPQEVSLDPDCPTKKIDEAKYPEKPCEKCGGTLIVRKSIYGSFYGCNKYPKCRNTEKIEK